ncbi:hypothetical protein [Pseudonocardia sp.]|uniref:hypothetical protein n=1 Tax=Pseudonocardia sp. TaxID=60912 RepID=UPI00261F178A|nr:hypothetical protein [Pseudonocardia sp.]
MISHALVVPVRVDLLTVDEQTVTAGPLADFSRLPWYDGRRDVNPGRPHLAEAVAATPFEDASAWLPPGDHLHWTLPEALTRGRHRPAGRPPAGQATAGRASADSAAARATAASVEFPRAPDRWLVGAPGGWWVVESDYLHPEGADASTDAVSYLMPPDQRGRAPFRYLGRRIPLADWRPHDPDAHYLDGLTALGWGHPAFHAYYPNCRSVFGFHRPGPGGGPYRVFGWYSRLRDDPVAAHAAAHPGLSDAELIAGLREEFGWTAVASDETPVARPTRLLCAGRWDPPAAPAPAPDRLDHVVLGATGAEALAAHLADLQHPVTAAHLPDDHHDAAAARHEEALESILLASRLDPSRPDAVATLREARHDKEFVGVPGGSGWTVRARGRGLPADAPSSPGGTAGTAPAAVLARLAELGRLGAQRDRLARRQDVLSAGLHSDWCAYLECKYPPRGSRLDRPDVDELRHHIELTSLADLETNIVEADRVTGELAALATTITAALAEDDARRCEVRAEEVLDWPLLAARAGAAGLLGADLAMGLAARPDDATLRAAALDALRRVVRAATPPEVPVPATAAPAVVAWLGDAAPDAAGAQATARVARSLFPRAEHAGHAQRWSAVAAERAREVGRAQRHRVVLELVLPGALAPARLVRHELDVRPGPRFWRPRDPVLLLAGPAVAAQDRHPERGGTVYCGVVGLGAEPATGLVAAHDDRGDPAGPSSPVAREIAAIVAAARGADPVAGDRQPIMLDWTVALHEEPAEGEPAEGDHGNVGHRYAPGHLTRRYTLRENRPDLEPRHPGTAPRSPRVSLVTGRSMLSAHPGRQLRAALERLPETANPFVREVAAQAGEYLGTDAGRAVRSVSLSGLNAALLMHEPTLPVGIDDPLAFPEARAFATRVARAIGRHTRDAPRPLLHFMPIRAGRLQLVGLRLVDHFGQVRDVPVDGSGPALRGSQAMPITGLGEGTDRVEVFSLPPRLVPPARLQLRWLAAGTPSDEAGDHPSTGPVCGWLVPDVLDERLMVHAADGQALGSVDVPGRWRPAPGRDRIVPPEDIADPHLRRVVVHLLHRSAPERRNLLATLVAGLEQVMPDAHARESPLALLTGRPVAVVRASVRLEILGAPPVDRGWPQLRAALGGAPRSTAGLTDVRFPLRLGEHGLLDDGLLGFWEERGDGFADDRLAAPQAGPDEPAADGIERGGGHITLTVDGPPVHLTMLMDPRGSVHATTGVLPTKVLTIPPEQYGPALDRIAVTFPAAPLLSDPDVLQVALPVVPGHRWSFLERTGTGWHETPSAALREPRTDATLTGPQELREGWLRLSPVPGQDEAG